MRKLATIRRIASLTPIEGADRIELAQIDGWKVVVQKGLHVVGDLVVYFEIDSLLPIKDEFEFLRKGSYVKNSQEGEGFRLKTIKLRGQVSQGLIMPLREVSQFVTFDHLPGRYWFEPLEEDRVPLLYDDEKGEVADWYLHEAAEGEDVTQILGVKKYEKIIPAQLAGRVKGNFPSFVRKTDQERVQNFIGDFMTKFRDHVWEVSLKLDGSSMTAYFNDGVFGVCSRNFDLTETEDNSFWQAARRLDLEQKLRDLGDGYALQGELMGPGVQGNREGLKELDFYVFDIWDIEAQSYVSALVRQLIVETLGLKHAPVYEHAMFGFDSAEGFVEFAEHGYDGKSINHAEREGLVFKSVLNPNVSFKAISNKFLLSGGD